MARAKAKASKDAPAGKPSVKKRTAKEAAAKKTTPKKTAAKKAAKTASKAKPKKAAKSAAKKTALKKTAAPKKKATKAAAKKSAAKKTTARKKQAPKSAPKKAAPAEPSSKKTTARAKNNRPALTARQRRQVEDLLVAERDRILTLLKKVDQMALNSNDEGRERNRASFSIHQADFASDTQSLDLLLAQRKVEELRLEEVEGALRRVKTRNFGKCRMCAAKIPFERLKAKPSAEYCIECRRKMEMGR